MATSELSAVSRGRFDAHPSLTGRNRAGLLITFVLGVINLPSAFTPAPGGDGGDGPPLGVLILGSICGLIMAGACWVAWRQGKRAAVRVAAGVSILQALSAVPAFFVDVPAVVKALVAVLVVVTFVGVVLMLSPERRNPAARD
jgi:O-antigen/teichoic acid export membrane protein